ncbi:MAG: methyltransferase domain-containing protein [Azospirillaceae bacterium]
MTAIAAMAGRTTRDSRFWDRIARRYAAKPVADEAAYQEKLRLTREHFRPDSRVLEIGCGTGSTAIAHAPFVGHVEAVDFSARMIAIATAKAEEAGIANVAFRQAGLDDLDTSAPRYDAVLALSLLHLLADREAAIAAAWRMLKPGGVFVTNTVCLGDGMSYFRPIAPIGRWLGVLPMLRVFKVAELEASLRAAGFVIETVRRAAKTPSVFIIARKPAG